MQNETFSFKRFWTYFKYDLVQLWRRHSKAALLISLSGLIFYIVWVSGSLVFGHSWSAPGMAGRMAIGFVALAILELYYAYLYGFVTDRRKGSSYLMVPASTTEKFVSMLLNALIVVPVLFAVVFLGVDALLCLVDPTCSDPLIVKGVSGIREAVEFIYANSPEAFYLASLSKLVIATVLSAIFNNLYFLLCGLCFKKNKIVGAIAIAMGVSFLMSIVMGLFAPGISEWFMVHGADFEDPEFVKQFAGSTMTWANILAAVLAIGMGTAIIYRLKTIKH